MYCTKLKQGSKSQTLSQSKVIRSLSTIRNTEKIGRKQKSVPPTYNKSTETNSQVQRISEFEYHIFSGVYDLGNTTELETTSHVQTANIIEEQRKIGMA